MWRCLLLVIALVACERASPAPTPTDSAAALKLRDSIVADTIEYGFKTPPILLAFDGDCSAQADRILTLEPLVKRIRHNTLQLLIGAPDGTEADLNARFHERQDEVMAKITEQIVASHHTMAEVDAKEAEMSAKCRNDPKVKDAIHRTGVFKKKS